MKSGELLILGEVLVGYKDFLFWSCSCLTWDIKFLFSFLFYLRDIKFHSCIFKLTLANHLAIFCSVWNSKMWSGKHFWQIQNWLIIMPQIRWLMTISAWREVLMMSHKLWSCTLSFLIFLLSKAWNTCLWNLSMT